MDLPLYVYCPETTVGHRQKRPLAERILDWMARQYDGVAAGAAVSRAV